MTTILIICIIIVLVVLLLTLLTTKKAYNYEHKIDSLDDQTQETQNGAAEENK